MDTLQDHTQLYRSVSQYLHTPLFRIQVLLDIPEISRHEIFVRLNTDSDPEAIDPAPAYVTLETWTISGVALEGVGTEKYTPDCTYKACISLCRSVFTLLHVMPAWRLDTRLKKLSRSASNARVKIIVQALYGDPGEGTAGTLPFRSLNSAMFICQEGMHAPPATTQHVSFSPRESHSFPPIQHAAGAFCVSVEWLQNPVFWIMDRGEYLSATMATKPTIPEVIQGSEIVRGTPPRPIKPSPNPRHSVLAPSSLVDDVPMARPPTPKTRLSYVVTDHFHHLLRQISQEDSVMPPQQSLAVKRPDIDKKLPGTSFSRTTFTSSQDPAIMVLLRDVLETSNRQSVLWELGEQDAQWTLDVMQQVSRSNFFVFSATR